jgi:hypothetical protein
VAAGAADTAIQVARQIKDRPKAAFTLARMAEELSEQKSSRLASTAEAAMDAANQIEDAHRKTDVFVRLAQVLRRAGQTDQAAAAARAGLTAAADVEDQAEKLLDVVRLAIVLRDLGRQSEAGHARDVIHAQAQVLRAEARIGGTLRKRSEAVGLTAEALAGLGEFRSARELAAMALENDRLRAFEEIVFEYSRRRNPTLAASLEQIRQRNGASR